jgi:hypothetical protein
VPASMAGGGQSTGAVVALGREGGGSMPFIDGRVYAAPSLRGEGMPWLQCRSTAVHRQARPWQGGHKTDLRGDGGAVRTSRGNTTRGRGDVTQGATLRPGVAGPPRARMVA